MHGKLTLFLCIALVAPFPLVLASPPASEKRAATDPTEADEDFKIQGEYVGDVTYEEHHLRGALQVWAKGGGEFGVTPFAGGLPGEDKAKPTGRSGIAKRQKDGTAVIRDPQEKTKEARIRDGIVTFHDLEGKEAPQGKLVRVERKSETLGAKPPPGAVVLFAKGKVNDFEGGNISKEGWLSTLAPGRGPESRQKFQSCRLHLEFQVPYMPRQRDQNRGNSGVYLQGSYEVQVLDSFALEPAHNGCGGIYSVAPPKINMCYPPLSWQTYDIEFTAAKFDENGKKAENARVTVRHNGVVVHDGQEVDHATTARIHPEGPEPRGVYLQNHGSPVRYRNIWVVPKE